MKHVHPIARLPWLQGAAAAVVLLLSPPSQAAWWQRGAATWYYKDDWKATALTGSRGYRRVLRLDDPAESGWIVLWGNQGYRLTVNDKPVGNSVDGGLIDDFDLTPLVKGQQTVVLVIDGPRVCAEGEVVTRRGTRIRIDTGPDWEKRDGGKPGTSPMSAGPSAGAFDRAHNGRLLYYNDEERGKSAIAKGLARLQRLDEQSIFLLRRFRPAEEIVSFDPASPWRRAEQHAMPLAEKARAILTDRAIPAQKKGDFAAAQAAAGEAGALIGDAQRAVAAATAAYRARREPDEFPESPFGWLNARALMGNDPAGWPFTVAPASGDFVDLAGLWDFRTDPDDEGLKKGWHSAATRDPAWRKIPVPGPWERAGFTQDNLKSPGDCPYKLPDRRTGDKPYNGFAWYRKEVSVPKEWQGRKIVLELGKIQDWGEVYVNGKALAPGRLNPPREHAVDPALLRFGQRNQIALRVYNHDKFGGITAAPVALYAAERQREERQTPGPLSLVRELSYPTASGPMRQTFLASALSPGVVVASEGPVLELWGWEARGYSVPAAARWVTAAGVQNADLRGPAILARGDDLAENWLLLHAQDRDVLLMMEGRPREIAWADHPLQSPCLSLRYERGPARVAIVVLPAGADAQQCRFWARALRRYPVSASEVVTKDDASGPLWRRHTLRYEYLELGGFGALEPLPLAPVPMLASFALLHKNPRVRVEGARTTGYASTHAPFRVAEGTDRLIYHAQGVDRAKVIKGIGELFHNKPPEVFQRMADWGADHVRYAWAFHAGWDIPLVKSLGSPPLADNEAAWTRLDQAVDRCNAAGMQMMLTWFFNDDSPQRDAGGAVRNSTRYWRQRPEVRQNVFELWRRIAQRYAGKPQWAVSYDFFNEPAYMNRDHWNEIVKKLTGVVRSVDKTHTIVWESADGWAQPDWCLWMEPSGDPNTLYSFHRYGKHWGYAYDEYYPGYKNSREQTQLEAILFSIRHNVPIHCGEFGISMIQPEQSGLAWLDDYLAFFERFGIGWNWWNYSGGDIYRTGLMAGSRASPHVAILRKWFNATPAARAKRPGLSPASPQSPGPPTTGSTP
jgi:aryl-phospho-beta-D-glucosidase BglC (GH1 family)